MFTFSKNKWLWSIVFGSFVISLTYSFYFRIRPTVDARAYDTIAQNIVAGHGFRENIDRDIAYDYSIVRAGPGYEYFLAGLYTIFGHRFEPVWIAQALLHAMSVLLLYCICLRVFKENGEKIGMIAAFLFALWPDLIEISAMLMTETLYLFFTILITYLFVRTFEKPERLPLAALLGMTTGIGILTRPPLLLFVPVFLFFFLSKRQYSAAFAFFFLLFAPLFPWIVRNYAVYHQFILTTRIGEYNLWVGNMLGADGGQISGGFNPVTDFIERNGVFGLKDAAGDAFRSFLLAYPFDFIRLCVLRFIRFFSLIRPMGFWFYQSGIGQMVVVTSSLIWIAGVFLAGFSGITHALKHSLTRILTYLAILVLTAPLVLLPTVVQSRYRFQIYPFLVLFAGYLIVKWQENKQVWKDKSVWIPAVILVLISLADIGISLGTVLERIHLFF